MSSNFADRVLDAVQHTGTPACVGIDPVFERLPAEIRARCPDPQQHADALLEFGTAIVEIVAPHVPVAKINIAFFEPYRGRGIDAYHELVRRARQAGLIVIGDIKRGDVGHTSNAYAEAHVVGDDRVDAVTMSPYLGYDALAPFVEAEPPGSVGVFVLVHTSNPSAGEVQHLPVTSESTVAEKVARLVDYWASGEGLTGDRGYSSVGAVVAPGEIQMGRRLRALLPKSLLLIPGFGAQGRGLDEVAACFQESGGGALVNSSRGVIYARDERAEGQGDWKSVVSAACQTFAEAVRQLHG